VAVSEGRELHVVPVGQLEERPPDRRWLVRSVVPFSSVVVIGGQPKSAKTFLGLDMAASVASGTPCLGHFVVERAGPSLVFLAEDSLSEVRSRVADLCLHRGLDFERLDLHVIAEPSLRLDQSRDRDALWATVEERRPLLTLLDPLVRLHTTLDENNSKDVAGLLGFLRELQRAFDTSVVLVHHTTKKHNNRPGQSLRGSGDLHAWLDAGAYLTWQRDQLMLTLEHRTIAAPDPVDLQLVSQPDGTGAHLKVSGGPRSPSLVDPPLTQRVVDELLLAEEPLRRGDLRQRLRVKNSSLGEALAHLENLGLVQRTAGGWAPAA
jgi:hypothetical protein